MKMGMTNIRARMENSKPPDVPMAKENQKASSCPSMRNGTKPKTVESVVRNTGIILWL